MKTFFFAVSSWTFYFKYYNNKYSKWFALLPFCICALILSFHPPKDSLNIFWLVIFILLTVSVQNSLAKIGNICVFLEI